MWIQVTTITLYLPQVTVMYISLFFLIGSGQYCKCKTELIRHFKCSHRGLRGTDGLGEAQRMSLWGFPPFCLQSGARYWSGKGDSLFFYSMCTHTVYIYIYITV